MLTDRVNECAKGGRKAVESHGSRQNGETPIKANQFAKTPPVEFQINAIIDHFQTGNRTKTDACIIAAKRLEIHHKTVLMISNGGYAGRDLIRRINRLHRRLHNPKPPNARSVRLAGTPEEIDAIVQGLGARERTAVLLSELEDVTVRRMEYNPNLERTRK